MLMDKKISSVKYITRILLAYYLLLYNPLFTVYNSRESRAAPCHKITAASIIERSAEEREREEERVASPPPPIHLSLPQTNLHSIFAPARGGHKSTAVYVPAWRPTTRTGSRPPSAAYTAASGPSSGRKKRRYRRRFWTGRRRRRVPGGRACPVSGGPAFCMRRTCQLLCGDAASP